MRSSRASSKMPTSSRSPPPRSRSRTVSSQAGALRCAGIQRFVDCYLDGEFAERDRGEFEAHLAECESCRGKVRIQAEWKKQIKAAAPHEKAPAALRNRIKRSVAKE